MAKKKDRDFQKVRIKVGRKLKRQNETVVDLSTRKIKLPRERERDETVSEKPGFRVIDDAIESLILEKPSVQLQALQTLNGIFDPFVKQMGTMGFSDCSPLTVQSRSLSQLVALYRSLFQFDQSQPTQFGLQLGSLSNTLFRLCRGAQDPQLCGALYSLFLKLLRICSLHPKFLDLLRTVDRCAVAALQRVESSWLWFGCRLAGLVLQAHSQFITTATLLGRSHQSIDPVEQLVRSSIYSRALVHLYRELKEEQAMRDVSVHRIRLLEATLAHFLNDQYSMNAAFNRGSHPFCYRPPSQSGIQSSAVDPYLTLNGHSLCQLQQQATCPHQIADLSLLDMESRNLLMIHRTAQSADALPPTLTKKAARKRSRGQALVSTRPTDPGLIQLANERALVFGMLEEGHSLLSELSLDSPDTSALNGIYAVVRCLRVLMEAKPQVLFAITDLPGKPDITNVFVRFVNRLTLVFPIQPSDSRIQKTVNGVSSISVGSHRQPLLLHAGLSRQEMRLIRKRNVKLKNRERNRTADQSKTQVPASSAGASVPISKVSPIALRVNQAVFELFPWLEWAAHNNSQVSGLWPPPDDMLTRLMEFLLTEVFVEDSCGVGDGGPSLGNLLAWLRSFDFYLLAPVRYPQRFCKTPSSVRLFLPVILLCLGRLLHRGLTTKRTDPRRPLARGQHRLLGRAAGLLVAFLTHESRQTMCISKTDENLDRNLIDSVNEDDDAERNWIPPQFDYDESWLRQTLRDRGYIPEEDETPHTPLNIVSHVGQFLSTMVLNEPPRLLFASPISIQSVQLINEHMEPTNLCSSEMTSRAKRLIPVQLVDDTWAGCLLRLNSLGYKPVTETLTSNPDLEIRLATSRRLQDQLIPLETLATELHLAVSDDALSGDQLGWLVPGYLPDTSGRYAAPMFWQSTKEYRHSYSWWTARLCK
ncbi:hypothetical protein CRM22_006229 [Opisthorchis felineus]|uniref:Uncharacterized protein n=1 Tax=Opisthorchis felineus TaxID=147828 RepID=A0A4S2LM62_OPIFE|nr:hypothetical protein CRM22_006229 [Opisthorchis felineus]